MCNTDRIPPRRRQFKTDDSVLNIPPLKSSKRNTLHSVIQEDEAFDDMPSLYKYVNHTATLNPTPTPSPKNPRLKQK